MHFGAVCWSAFGQCTCTVTPPSIHSSRTIPIVRPLFQLCLNQILHDEAAISCRQRHYRLYCVRLPFTGEIHPDVRPTHDNFYYEPMTAGLYGFYTQSITGSSTLSPFFNPSFLISTRVLHTHHLVPSTLSKSSRLYSLAIYRQESRQCATNPSSFKS